MKATKKIETTETIESKKEYPVNKFLNLARLSGASNKVSTVKNGGTYIIRSADYEVKGTGTVLGFIFKEILKSKDGETIPADKFIPALSEIKGKIAAANNQFDSDPENLRNPGRRIDMLSDYISHYYSLMSPSERASLCNRAITFSALNISDRPIDTDDEFIYNITFTTNNYLLNFMGRKILRWRTPFE